MFSPSETSLNMSEDQEMFSIIIDEFFRLLMKRGFSELNQEMLSVDPPEEQSFQAVENENGHKFNLTETEHISWEALSSPAREGKAKAGSPDPLVEQSCQAVVNENGHKFNMTEGEYNLWKDMPEKLKDMLIQIIPEKAEVVGRLRSEACEEKAKAASPDNEPAEHTNPETRGGSSTAQNEPPPTHEGLPVVGDHQVHNLQVNKSMNQTVNHSPGSSNMASGRFFTQADNEPAEHTNLKTGGGSSTAQNESLPNHQGLPVVGDHQVHKLQVNAYMADNEPAEHTNPETGGSSSTAQNETPPNHQVLFVDRDFLGDGDHQVHNLQVNGLFNFWEEFVDMLIPMCPRKAQVVGRPRSAHEGKAKAGSTGFLPSLAFQDTVSKVNLWTSLAFISAPIFLDRKYYKDRNTVSYKLFDAFMICIILSFTGAFCALLIRNKPKLAVLRGCYFLLSIVSMASALSIMGYALF